MNSRAPSLPRRLRDRLAPVCAFLAAWLCAALPLPAVAQDVYPTRPVTLIVPFPPGGVADTVGRPVAEAMSRLLGQPVLVENKAGAGGGVGMAQVARARPDGYTLLMALSSVTIIPEADKVLERVPMYQLQQLVPIARFTADPTVLVVRADSPWKTLAEFLADARVRPGAITFGSSGTYGTMHVPIEMLKQASATFMLHVPYTGAGPAVVGLLGGQVEALATGPSTIVQLVRAGRLRALAHWGEGRLAALPEVPSLKELGYSVGFTQWAGLFAPAGTPEPVVARLREVARRAAEDERVVRTIATAGTPMQYLDAPEFARFVQADAAVMAAVVRRIGKQ
ncbi:MAG: tripartite tricarboxylate transporter substrate binding protein [Burkholderiales bacterium]|jgi:tripartite-type tricarboxylate transporter receptor subunit TctC|nr:tripartite tricarboxylate transporter substrate binding protein [Burkholderiales bacterium]